MASNIQCTNCGHSPLSKDVKVIYSSGEPPLQYSECPKCKKNLVSVVEVIELPDDSPSSSEKHLNHDEAQNEVFMDGDYEEMEYTENVDASTNSNNGRLNRQANSATDIGNVGGVPKRQRILLSSNSCNQFSSNSASLHSKSDSYLNKYASEKMSIDSEISTDVNAKQMEEILERIANVFPTLPCSQCNEVTVERLQIDDTGPVFQCKNCNSVTGFDDSMNFFEKISEYLHLLQTGLFHINACQCGNSDPTQFITLSDGNIASDGDVIRVLIECQICKRRKYLDEIDFIPDGNVGENAFQYSSPGNEMISVRSGNHPDDVYIVSDDDDCTDGNRAADGCAGGNRAAAPRRPIGNGCTSGRTQIKRLSDLKAGDHIAWHQSLAYWHHALVVEDAPHWLRTKGQICVIHYNGPVGEKGPSSLISKGRIMEEYIEVDVDKEELYRYHYDLANCYSSDVAIENGRKRLGECEYNILNNNCEHFVTWCKTGHHRSNQSNTFKETAKQYVSYMAGSATNPVARRILRSVSHNSASTNNLVVAGRKLATVALSGGDAAGVSLGKAAVTAASEEGKRLVAPGKLMGAGVMVGLEVANLCVDVAKARRQRVAGEISREEFVKISIKRTCESAGSLSAMALVLPLPAAWIGLPLAAFVGRGVGAMMGRKAGAAWAKQNSSE